MLSALPEGYSRESARTLLSRALSKVSARYQGTLPPTSFTSPVCDRREKEHSVGTCRQSYEAEGRVELPGHRVERIDDDGVNAEALSSGQDPVDGVRQKDVSHPLPTTPKVTG
jgi:hypothetical protein